MRLVNKFATMEFALLGLVGLAVSLVLSLFYPEPGAKMRFVTLLVLSVSIALGLVLNRRLRRKLSLFIFHLCLLLIPVFALIGDLMSFHGRLEIAGGQVFHPEMVEVVSRGPLSLSIDRVPLFVQSGFEVRYEPGLMRRETTSTLRLQDGVIHEITTNRALVLDSFRFSITSNKGFSALISWETPGSQPLRGFLNFPSYPVRDWDQVNEWLTPAGDKLDLELVLSKRPDMSVAWVLEKSLANGLLKVSSNTTNRVLGEGESLDVGTGRLRFEGIYMWVGYNVTSDPLERWVFLLSITAVAALFIHFNGTFHWLPFARQSDLRARGGERVV